LGLALAQRCSERIIIESNYIVYAGVYNIVMYKYNVFVLVFCVFFFLLFFNILTTSTKKANLQRPLQTRSIYFKRKLRL